MKALAAHVGKDLRDQRATLLVLAAIVALLGLVTSAALPASVVQDGTLIPWMLRAGGALGALALAADLVPSEGERGTLALLGRLPQGLGTAFTSKALLVAAAALPFALLGALNALLGWHLRIPAPHTLAVPDLDSGTVGLAVLSVVGLAVPYAAALAYAIRISDEKAAWDWIVATDGTLSLVVHVLSGLCVAVASFVRGRRWSSGTMGPLRVGLRCIGKTSSVSPASGAWSPWCQGERRLACRNHLRRAFLPKGATSPRPERHWRPLATERLGPLRWARQRRSAIARLRPGRDRDPAPEAGETLLGVPTR